MLCEFSVQSREKEAISKSVNFKQFLSQNFWKFEVLFDLETCSTFSRSMNEFYEIGIQKPTYYKYLSEVWLDKIFFIHNNSFLIAIHSHLRKILLLSSNECKKQLRHQECSSDYKIGKKLTTHTSDLQIVRSTFCYFFNDKLSFSL